MPPRVSVIIPAWRAEGTIGRAVRSLIDQTFADWEAVVAADDDRDYAAILAGEGLDDPRIRHARTPAPRSGASAARNAAWAVARGAVAAPLDADDTWMARRLEVLAPLAEARGAAADNVRVVDDASGAVLGHLFPPEEPARILDAAGFLATSVPIMALVRRDCMDGWDADVDLCDDLPFNLRAIDRAGGLPVIAEALHDYRVREGSICHSPDSDRRADRGYATCLARLASDGLGIRDPEIRALFRRSLDQKRALNRAFMEWRNGRPLGGTFQEFVAARAR